MSTKWKRNLNGSQLIWTYNDRTFIRQDENKPSFSFDWEEDLTKFKSHKSRLMLYMYKV